MFYDYFLLTYKFLYGNLKYFFDQFQFALNLNIHY